MSRNAKAFAEAIAKSSCQKREHAMSPALHKKQGRIGGATFLPNGRVDSFGGGMVRIFALCATLGRFGVVTCFNVPQARFMLMLVMLRYPFLSGHHSQFRLTDNEAITLMFLFPISLRFFPKWPPWHMVLMVDYTFSRKQMRTSMGLTESTLS